ncbi:hypothetical protein HGI30_04630 [Paenibacillus albicereus]|uniref:Uncharacterized protein n=1 Tax=Paenibacillus albicereus TaxID=2726185 RepID=A0A6H2GU48_9BACL|nr:hypothetical protein [Paenibacillus albicereus]QJC50915.1 hypothetical protein HGI30_04630 [Paenibacillus albicereus]
MLSFRHNYLEEADRHGIDCPPSSASSSFRIIEKDPVFSAPYIFREDYLRLAFVSALSALTLRRSPAIERWRAKAVRLAQESRRV